MATPILTKKSISLIIHGIYLVFITSFIFSFRAISNISIVILLLTGIITAKNELTKSFSKNPVLLLIAGCALFFLLQLFSVLYTESTGATWNKIFLKSGIILIPLGIYLTSHNSQIPKERVLFQFCIILFIASLFCLISAILSYFNTDESSVFFYHALVSPLAQHAVFYSIYVFVALLFLIESGKRRNKPHKYRGLFPCLVIFFSIFLFLLSSKLIISAYIIYLFYNSIEFILQDKKRRQLIIVINLVALFAISVLFINHNPISNRFYEITGNNVSLIRQNKFNPGDYFNGVQFRLLQWKLVAEILNEKQKWWTGLGPADDQVALDQKYISKSMYTGVPGTNDHGYLGYNTHNQFLESLLSSGIPGLLIFGIIGYAIIKMALLNKSRFYWIVSLIILVYSFIESVFETQYGISLFFFFPIFPDQLYFKNKQESK